MFVSCVFLTGDCGEPSLLAKRRHGCDRRDLKDLQTMGSLHCTVVGLYVQNLCHDRLPSLLSALLLGLSVFALLTSRQKDAPL